MDLPKKRIRVKKPRKPRTMTHMTEDESSEDFNPVYNPSSRTRETRPTRVAPQLSTTS